MSSRTTSMVMSMNAGLLSRRSTKRKRRARHLTGWGHLFGQRANCACEALHWRVDQARADLAHAGTLRSNSGVDLGQDARLHDHARIDACRRAAEIQDGQRVRVAFAERDLVHAS